jgi:hypothetical protein
MTFSNKKAAFAPGPVITDGVVWDDWSTSARFQKSTPVTVAALLLPAAVLRM